MSVHHRRIALTSANVNWLYPTLAFLLTLFAIAPLAFPGFFQSYTGYSAVYNLIDLDTHLSGILTWAPVWGRAYDFLRLDGPLGYWLAQGLHLVGVSYLGSIKLVYALAFVLSALGMFKLGQRVLKNDAAALLASALYVYFPAHIATVYVRGAFGEALAWGLFPFALWAALGLTPERLRWGSVLGCSALFAAVVLAQPGLGILFGVLACVWLLVLETRKVEGRRTFPLIALAAVVVGLFVGALLLVPALTAQSSISTANGFVSAFVYPFQMLSASWGTALPRTDFMAEAPYQIGIAALGLTILAVALLLKGNAPEQEVADSELDPQRSGGDQVRRMVWFSIGASIVLLVLMTPLLEPLWNVGLNAFVQYPFQLLAFVGLLLSLAAASLVTTDARFQEIPLLAALVIVPLLAVYPYLSPTFTEFSPTKPALAIFNNGELALLDAKIVRPPGVWRHGATVELDLTWQALKQPNRDYTAFLHILDETGAQWGATDEKPQGDTLSTLKWTPGQVYQDTHSVQIDLTGPTEGYHMDLGIYQSATGERALTETGADSVRIEPQQ